MIRFLLNTVEEQVVDLDPNTTVLSWLREYRGRTGTKEGCASGDCGACTVVVGELQAGQLCYTAINACITPIGNVHGKQLLSVEDLQHQNQLHPVQQAMVDCHASQCGFCTPGFVMSLFAYQKNHATPQPESLGEALGGNLCRCTGYRPILDAGVQMYEQGTEDRFTADSQQIVKKLERINSSDTAVELAGAGYRYLAPTTLDSLAAILVAEPSARLVAGATDLALEITQGLQSQECLVYTGRVATMKTCTEDADGLTIGAAATYSECKQLLCQEYPALAELLERLGSLQIRNQGTLGGNIGNASPIGDMPPVLIALGARLQLRRGDSTRLLPVEDYFVSYKVTALQAGEFIERILIPRAQSGQLFQAYKISKRLEDDISAVCGAFNLHIADNTVHSAVIAFGGMAAIPRRATACEQALIGQPWTQSTIDVAMAALSSDYAPISDFRASAEYRQRVAMNLLQRLFLESAAASASVRVTHYA